MENLDEIDLHSTGVVVPTPLDWSDCRAVEAEAPRGKNIIICSDGTGNTAIKGRGTNVFKLFEAVDSHGHRRDPSLVPQLTYYDDGVGTESFKYARAFAG